MDPYSILTVDSHERSPEILKVVLSPEDSHLEIIYFQESSKNTPGTYPRNSEPTVSEGIPFILGMKGDALGFAFRNMLGCSSKVGPYTR